MAFFVVFQIFTSHGVHGVDIRDSRLPDPDVLVCWEQTATAVFSSSVYVIYLPYRVTPSPHSSSRGPACKIVLYFIPRYVQDMCGCTYIAEIGTFFGEDMNNSSHCALLVLDTKTSRRAVIGLAIYAEWRRKQQRSLTLLPMRLARRVFLSSPLLSLSSLVLSCLVCLVLFCLPCRGRNCSRPASAGMRRAAAAMRRRSRSARTRRRSASTSVDARDPQETPWEGLTIPSPRCPRVALRARGPAPSRPTRRLTCGWVKNHACVSFMV